MRCRAWAGRARRTGAVVVAVCLAVAMVVASPTATAAQEDPAADQRVVKLRADYRIEPAQGEVQVVEEITVSNVRGSTRSGSVVTSYFWTGHTIWVPADAENLSITVEGEPLEFEVAETIQGVDIISADYRRNLNFGQTRVIDVTYTLPTYPPGEGERRINGAFFDLELLICCNFEEVDLTVSMPSSFDVATPTNLSFVSQPAGARQEYVFSQSEEQSGQFTELILTDWYGVDEAGFESSPVTIGAATVDIVAPPDDTAWSADTSTLVSDVASELEALTGAPPTLDGAVFRQGLDTNFDRWGSDGPFDEPVVVPRDYDEVAMAITVAKAWLRDGPFDDIDIERGLAADLGTEALRRARGTETTPAEPTEGGLTELVNDERAFWVVHQVSEELGYDGIRALLQMASDNETAYVGEGDPERSVTIPNDWRRFVDLAEQRLGSEIVADLVGEHIVTGADAALLTARADAVAAYEDIVDRADTAAPIGIRDRMTNWEFDEADSLLARAAEVLDERDRVVALAESKGQDPALPLGEAWATAATVGDFDAVQDLILERENEINSGSLIRNLLIGLGVVVVVGGAAAAAYVLSRRNKQATPVPATVGAAPYGNLPAPPPGFGGQADPADPANPGGPGGSLPGPSSPAEPWAGPPGGPSPGSPGDAATLPAPPPPGALAGGEQRSPEVSTPPTDADLAAFPAPGGPPTESAASMATDGGTGEGDDAPQPAGAETGDDAASPTAAGDPNQTVVVDGGPLPGPDAPTVAGHAATTVPGGSADWSGADDGGADRAGEGDEADKPPPPA